MERPTSKQQQAEIGAVVPPSTKIVSIDQTEEVRPVKKPEIAVHKRFSDWASI